MSTGLLPIEQPNTNVLHDLRAVIVPTTLTIQEHQILLKILVCYVDTVVMFA